MGKGCFEVNQKVEIIQDEKYYKCIIQDKIEEKICINIPVRDGVYLTLKVGDEIEGICLAKGALVYGFISKIIGKKKENNLHMYVLSEPTNIKKIQRRDYVRVELLENIFYRVINKENESQWKKGIMIDLSGGGLKLKTTEPLKSNDLVEVNIILEDGEKLSIKSRAVRAVKLNNGEYLIGIRFEELLERYRDKIIQKVFTIMRKQREIL